MMLGLTILVGCKCVYICMLFILNIQLLFSSFYVFFKVLRTFRKREVLSHKSYTLLVLILDICPIKEPQQLSLGHLVIM